MLTLSLTTFRSIFLKPSFYLNFLNKNNLINVCSFVISICFDRSSSYFCYVIKLYCIAGKLIVLVKSGHLCGLVVRVPGNRSRGPGLYSRCYRIFEWWGLERGPLSLLTTIEELLELRSSSSSLGN
jgi:hypothetical protein